MSTTTIPAFSFHQQEFTVLEDLVNAMGTNWIEGRQLLFSGKLREHVRKTDSSFANSCASAEKEAQEKANESNRIFLRWLCKYPGIRGLYWQSHNYGGVKRISSTLAARDETLQKLLLHMMKGQFLSTFLRNIGAPDGLIDNTRFLEKACNKSDTKFSRRNVLPILECLLNGNKSFSFSGHQFETPKDLALYLQTFADTSKSALSRCIQPLFQDDYNFDPRFEAWILMHGYQHELTLWKSRFQEGVGSSEDIEEFFFDEDQEQIIEARQQLEADFVKTLDGFEDKFIELLKQYQDRIDDPVAYNALMSDYFPTQKLQSYLLMALYRMDIVKAISDAVELTELLTARFEKRLIKDFGVKEAFAKWAVSEWCYCYGELILNKQNAVHYEIS